jgi:hypothetical protein
MSRRTRLSSTGLRVSAAGFDAATATDDGHAITFDSNWTDIAKISAVGIATEQNVTIPGGTTPFWRAYATYPNLGYKPFVEMRRLVGSVVFDDFFDASLPSGSYSIIDVNQCFGPGFASPQGAAMLFVVYQIPVPSQ